LALLYAVVLLRVAQEHGSEKLMSPEKRAAMALPAEP
jgi:hypothetical protein